MTIFQQSFSQAIKDVNGTPLFDEPLKNHCSFHIGGNAEVLFIPKTEKALVTAMCAANESKTPCRVLGNGSNVLIDDNGLKGLVIKLAGGLNGINYLGDGIIEAEAGAGLTRLCSFALENSLSGLEFAYGIPGSVGGAAYMNAGAYGGEINDILISVRSTDKTGSDIREDGKDKLKYSYRTTPFMKNGRVITSVRFRLEKGNKKKISEKMNALMAKRRLSQPLEFPSAGSTFKRPVSGYAAALIEQCGLKGLSCGDAQVSRKHAGFVINTGNATCADVLRLMEKIQHEVHGRFGVDLIPEVEILKD